MNLKTELGKISPQPHNFTYTEKRWYEFLREYAKRLPGVLNIFIATIISLWAIAEILMVVTNNRVSLRYFVLPVILLALVVSMYKAYLIQKQYVPEYLKSESEKTQQIYRKQKCGWQFKIAMQMLVERIQATEATLDRIKRGTEFVKPNEMDYQNYIDWLCIRPEVMLRLLQSVSLICTKDLPSILATTKSESDLKYLRNEIEALANMYEIAKNLELECHEILPPEKLKSVHEMTYGWTDPIRKGVQHFLEILNDLSNIDRKQIKDGKIPALSFEIVFEVPENISEYRKRINEITDNS